jgi:hypothetical protein
VTPDKNAHLHVSRLAGIFLGGSIMLVLLVILVLAAVFVLAAPGRAVDVCAKIGGVSFLLWVLIQLAKFLMSGTAIAGP